MVSAICIANCQLREVSNIELSYLEDNAPNIRVAMPLKAIKAVSTSRVSSYDCFPLIQCQVTNTSLRMVSAHLSFHASASTFIIATGLGVLKA